MLFYCNYSFGQIQDLETKFYDLFVPGSNGFLIGNEDLRYHPAREDLPLKYSVVLNSNYHDLFREYGGPNDNKTNFQYGMGVNTEIPLSLSNYNFCLNVELEQKAFSFSNYSKDGGAEFSGNNFKSYGLKSNLLAEDSVNKIGVNFKYLIGQGKVNLNISQYPYSESDGLLDKYFYNLLEPAFGNNIYFGLSGIEQSYAIEYCRKAGANFNYGINFYRELNTYNTGIDYYSNVNKIEGRKNLSGYIEYSRNIIGLSAEYKLNKLGIKSLITYSIPDFKLQLNQDGTINSGNVNLEILHLSDGKFNGKGAAVGLGVSYPLSERVSFDLGFMLISNYYSGSLYASTPVLGFEIIPIAHQVNLDFDDRMLNEVYSAKFYHEVSSIWSYSISLECIASSNDISYNYNILSEFGLGTYQDEADNVLLVDLYKINLGTRLNITDGIAVQLFFDQYIPVLKQKGNPVTVVNPPSENNVPQTSNKKEWGGSIYNISIIYSF